MDKIIPFESALEEKRSKESEKGLKVVFTREDDRRESAKLGKKVYDGLEKESSDIFADKFEEFENEFESEFGSGFYDRFETLKESGFEEFESLEDDQQILIENCSPSEIRLFFNPKVLSPSAKRVTSAIDDLLYDGICSGANLDRFTKGEVRVFFNPLTSGAIEIQEAELVIASAILMRDEDISI